MKTETKNDYEHLHALHFNINFFNICRYLLTNHHVKVCWYTYKLLSAYIANQFHNASRVEKKEKDNDKKIEKGSEQIMLSLINIFKIFT